MASQEEMKDKYFNYLVEEIFDAIFDANEYKDQEFQIVKLDLLLNLLKMFKTREEFEKIINILKEYENNNKILAYFKKI